MLVNTHCRAKARRFAVIGAFVCAGWVTATAPVFAQSPVVAPPLAANATVGMPELKALGGGLLRVFGFQVYNVYLWTPGGAAFDRNKPYALDLQYLRNFSAKQLAERSIDEMRGQGTGSDAIYPKWLAEMQRVFADVKEGDRLTGVATPTKTAKFFYNGIYRGEVADPAFTDAFFGIWLSEKSSQLRVRDRLLGKPE
jgi:hypothetical protein